MAREARVPMVVTAGRGKHQPWKKQQQIAPSVDVALLAYRCLTQSVSLSTWKEQREYL